MYSQVTLTIVIKELENSKGQILLELNDGKEKFVGGYKGKIVNNKCTIVIDSLKPGKYAFKYFHDENMNEELDTNWLGIPDEGYGFSKNVTGTFGPPDFEDTIFSVYRSKKVICTPTYIF